MTENTRLTIQVTTSEIKAIAEGARTATASEAVFLAKHLLAEGKAYTLCFNERMQLLSEAWQREAKLREALAYIRDIEKPMAGQAPATDWLAWYTTSSQQAEAAANALSPCE